VTFARVVRGGSWINNQDNARASYRNNNSPDNRNNNIGFRVSCASHIAPVFQWCRLVSCTSYAGLAAGMTSGIVRRPRFADRSEEWFDGAG
jgi:hypothetical protein